MVRVFEDKVSQTGRCHPVEPPTKTNTSVVDSGAGMTLPLSISLDLHSILLLLPQAPAPTQEQQNAFAQLMQQMVTSMAGQVGGD